MKRTNGGVPAGGFSTPTRDFWLRGGAKTLMKIQYKALMIYVEIYCMILYTEEGILGKRSKGTHNGHSERTQDSAANA